jgi:hypothetical protein
MSDISSSPLHSYIALSLSVSLHRPYIMHPLNVLRGYSDFFKSGFREFTNRDRGQSSSSHNSDGMLNDTSPSTPTKTASGTTNHRRRAVSMIVNHTPRENLRQRRSSFLSFSSQWFDHRSATTTPSFDETSTISSTSSISSVGSRDSLREVWIRGGGSYTALNERYIPPFLPMILAGTKFSS